MSLKRNIIRVFSANFLSMMSGVIIGFVVPAILSVDGYADLKTYTFYLSYIGVLHFGFVDGMYIKYGGKEYDDIDRSDLKLEHLIFFIIEIVITVLTVVFALLKRDVILLLFGVSIIPVNALSFHKLLYQAIGEFKKYTNILNIYTIVYLLTNVLLAVVFRSENYVYYCFTTIIANLIVFAYLEIKFYINFKGIDIKYDKRVWRNIKVGIFILLANLAVVFFYGLDRWFIKWFYTTADFAYYSFAFSMLNIINMMIGAVAVTFYNFLAKGPEESEIKSLKSKLVIAGTGMSLAYFPFSAIVNIILKKYILSLDIISVSFAAFPYIIVINSLFVNLYKASNKEKRYLGVVVKMLLVSVVFNGIAVLISDNPVAIAVATTLSFIVWYIYSSFEFKYLKIKSYESIYLAINIILFLLISHNLNWFIGGVTYLLIYIITTIVIYKSDVKEIISLVKNRAIKRGY